MYLNFASYFAPNTPRDDESRLKSINCSAYLHVQNTNEAILNSLLSLSCDRVSLILLSTGTFRCLCCDDKSSSGIKSEQCLRCGLTCPSSFYAISSQLRGETAWNREIFARYDDSWRNSYISAYITHTLETCPVAARYCKLQRLVIRKTLYKVTVFRDSVANTSFGSNAPSADYAALLFKFSERVHRLIDSRRIALSCICYLQNQVCVTRRELFRSIFS